MKNSKGIILQKKSLKQWVSVTDLMFVELLLLLTLLIQTKELSLLSLSFVTIVYIVFGEDMDNFLKEVFKPSSANRLSRRFQILFQFITLGTAVRLCRFLRNMQLV